MLRFRFLLLALIFASLAGRTATATVIAGPIVNPANGHSYLLLAGAAWTTSEAEAISLGGHLATIRSQAENDWVFNTFTPLADVAAGRFLWIGLTDTDAPDPKSRDSFH